MNIVEQFEQKEIARVTAEKNIPDFAVGDTVRVNVRIVEGANERIQAYEGVVIARRNAAVASSFLVRKISHGEGVERKFMLYSPMIQSITLVRSGVVRRSKLYYLRALRGKAARIKEKLHHKIAKVTKAAS
jgi:large subunit ribosomal protein L19